MISYRGAALVAVSYFYAKAKVDIALDACNVYLEAALKVAPELGQMTDDETWDGHGSGTVVGVGSPTMQIRVNRTPMIRVKGT